MCRGINPPLPVTFRLHQLPVGEDKVVPCIFDSFAHLRASAVAEANRDNLSLQVLTSLFHDSSETLHLSLAKVVFGLSHNPDRLTRASRIGCLPENVNLDLASVPKLGSALKLVNIPIPLALEHIVNDNVSDILDVTTNGFTQPPYLFRQALQSDLGSSLSLTKLLHGFFGARLCLAESLNRCFDAVKPLLCSGLRFTESFNRCLDAIESLVCPRLRFEEPLDSLLRACLRFEELFDSLLRACLSFG